MNIHEYQAKQVLAQFGVPVSKGIPCTTADEVHKAFDDLGEPLAVVKAQIHAAASSWCARPTRSRPAPALRGP